MLEKGEDAMKKHIELTEQEVERIKTFKIMTKKPTLFKVITETLEYIKANNDCFDYVSMPSVCYSKPFYLFYGGELVGQLNMEVRKDIVTFLHKQKEYSFAWSEMQDNISGLSTIIEDYATSYDGFEKTMKLHNKD